MSHHIVLIFYSTFQLLCFLYKNNFSLDAGASERFTKHSYTRSTTTDSCTVSASDFAGLGDVPEQVHPADRHTLSDLV